MLTLSINVFAYLTCFEGNMADMDSNSIDKFMLVQSMGQNTCQWNGTMTYGFISRSSCLHEFITTFIDHVSAWCHTSSSWPEQSATSELIFQKSNANQQSTWNLSLHVQKHDLLEANSCMGSAHIFMSYHHGVKKQSIFVQVRHWRLWFPDWPTDRLTDRPIGASTVGNWPSACR